MDRSTTVAITLTPSATYLQAATPRPTPKITAEALPTAEVRPTRTPQPTLDPLEAEKIVLEYLRSNGGCQLPCWWGIRPGVTTQDEAQTFLEPIVQIDKNTKGEMGSFQYQIPDAPEGLFIYGHIGSSQGKVSYIYVFQNGTAQSFSLYQLLTDYGKPEQVKLQVDQEVPDGYPLFKLLVLYQRIGIIAEFEAIAKPDGQNLRGCFKGGFDYSGGPDLWLYDPSDRKLNDLTAFYPSIRIQSEPLAPPVLSVEQAVGIDLETFYRTYKDPENYCIFTPSILWPDIDEMRATATAMFFQTQTAQPSLP